MPSPAHNKEIQDIIDSGAPLIKKIVNVEAAVLRNQAAAAASRGEYPKSGCPHPVNAIEQFEDTDPVIQRRGQLTNLFQCKICRSLLWLVSPYGEAASDGHQ